MNNRGINQIFNTKKPLCVVQILSILLTDKTHLYDLFVKLVSTMSKSNLIPSFLGSLGFAKK